MKNNPRATKLFIWLCCWGLLMTAAVVSVESQKKPATKPLDTIKKVPDLPRLPPVKRLPDLTVEELYLDREYRGMVKVANLGPGSVSEVVWTVASSVSSSDPNHFLTANPHPFIIVT